MDLCELTLMHFNLFLLQVCKEHLNASYSHILQILITIWSKNLLLKYFFAQPQIFFYFILHNNPTKYLKLYKILNFKW